MTAAMPARTPSERASSRGYYVYAVAQAREAAVSDDVGGVDPRFPVRILEHDGLAAIVSEVPLDEFGAETLEENVRRPEWLAEKAVAHDRVVAGALAADGLLPMRFGTIFASEEHVRDMLTREHTAFVELLHRVHGKREWGVKAFFSREQVRRRIEAFGQAAAELSAEVASAAEGRSYFARKKLERLLDDEVARTTAECAEQAHRRLAACASDARVNPPQPHELSGRTEEMLLNGAYLVAREQEAALRRAVAELSGEYAEVGIAFELTGPWPPYNFVRLTTGGWNTS